MIGLKISRQFLNQWEPNPKTNHIFSTCDSSRAMSKLQVIATNSDWFIALFAPVVIGRSNYSDVGFSDSHLKTAELTKQFMEFRVPTFLQSPLNFSSLFADRMGNVNLIIHTWFLLRKQSTSVTTLNSSDHPQTRTLSADKVPPFSVHCLPTDIAGANTTLKSVPEITGVTSTSSVPRLVNRNKKG